MHSAAYDRRPDCRGRSLLEAPHWKHPEAGYKKKMREAVVSLVTGSGDWAEFGVGPGRSTKQILRQLPKQSKLYGFDTWKGLPQDFAGVIPKGGFSTGGKIPQFLREDSRFVPVVGKFHRTIPDWASKQKRPLAFVHIDCDLYLSTKCVLKNIQQLINGSTIVLFDELAGHPGYLQNEYRAFVEFLDESGREFEWVLTSSDYDRVAVRFMP